jgi:hypothetical protein
MMNILEPLGPLSGLGPEQGHEDAAARDSDDHELASFMVQEFEEVIFRSVLEQVCIYLLLKGYSHSV